MNPEGCHGGALAPRPQLTGTEDATSWGLVRCDDTTDLAGVRCVRVVKHSEASLLLVTDSSDGCTELFNNVHQDFCVPPQKAKDS